MTRIEVHANYGLAVEDRGRLPAGFAEFHVPGEGSPIVKVDAGAGRCQARAVLELGATEHDRLRSSCVPTHSENYEVDTDQYPAEAGRIVALMGQALHGVLAQLKYRLDWHDLETGLFAAREKGDGIRWSSDGREWYEMPIPVGGAILMRGQSTLRDETIARIQHHIANENPPLDAWEHLHRAFAQRAPRGMWIDATIAAELAIKEYLGRRVPEMQVLLDNLPAPPLERLYGEVLKSVDGQEAKEMKALREGQRVRNRLLHRPRADEPELQEAFDYLKAIENVLLDLQERIDARVAP